MPRLMFALAALLAALMPVGAWGACSTTITDCPTTRASTITVGGGTYTGVHSYTGTGTAAGTNTNTQWNYVYNGIDATAEARPWIITANASYTNAASNAVTLGIDAELNTIVGTYGFGSSTYNPQGSGGGEHQAAVYGHSVLRTAPAMFGCTIGTTCPGTTFATNGLNAFADNVSTGELYSARSIIIHSPTTAKSFTVNGYKTGFGGTVDMWSGISSDDARSGIDVGQAVGIIVGANAPYVNNGFGAASPVAAVHARCGNRTDAATGWISGNTLYLATAPTVSLALGPGNVVTGPGMTSAHLMAAVSTKPVAGVTPGGYIAYSIDGSAQTVGSQAAPIALNFAETCIQFVTQNFTAGGLATIGFIGGSGASNALFATIDQGADSTAPLGNFLDFQVGGVVAAYVYGPGGSRPAGMAVGFSAPPPSIPLDALWVSGSMQADVLRINASGATSMTASGNVGIGLGRVGVSNRLVVKGVDTGATAAILVQDSNAATVLQVLDNGGVIAAGRGQGTNWTSTGAPFGTGAGQVSIGGTTAAATSCGSIASAAGCIQVNVAGTIRYVPFF